MEYRPWTENIVTGLCMSDSHVHTSHFFGLFKPKDCYFPFQQYFEKSPLPVQKVCLIFLNHSSSTDFILQTSSRLGLLGWSETYKLLPSKTTLRNPAIFVKSCPWSFRLLWDSRALGWNSLPTFSTNRLLWTSCGLFDYHFVVGPSVCGEVMNCMISNKQYILWFFLKGLCSLAFTRKDGHLSGHSWLFVTYMPLPKNGWRCPWPAFCTR